MIKIFLYNNYYNKFIKKMIPAYLLRPRQGVLQADVKVSEEEMTECEKLFMKNEYTEAVIF